MLAHRSLAFSCIYYLNTRYTSILNGQASLPPNAAQNQILQSFNGLDDYAHEFWIDHVLACIKLADEVHCSGMIKALLDFAALWSRDLPLQADKTKPVAPSAELPSVPNLHPKLNEFVRKILAFRSQSRVRERNLVSYEGISFSSAKQSFY